MIAITNQTIIKQIQLLNKFNELQYNREQYEKYPESVDKTKDDIYRIQWQLHSLLR